MVVAINLYQEQRMTIRQSEGLKMFKVIHKETGEIATVYGFTGSMFMLWSEEDHSWWFDFIENYEPLPKAQEGENV